MGPHMFCSYSGIAMCKFDLKVLNYKPDVLRWERLREDVFVLWKQSFKKLDNIFNFVNNIQ